ncbi:MAG: ATP-binding protein, partial [Candidatus Tectomicrobia bacterium]|nr:ATP-binding protein [Candidatus Tectomicrobia bacterium]
QRIKEQLACILESITDAVLLVNAAGCIVVANAAARDLLGPDLEGDEIRSRAPGLETILSTTTPIRDAELKVPFPAGSRIVLATAVPVTDVEQPTIGLVVAVKDITEQRLLQERLQRERRMAALGQVASSVAHEIRNPLSVIEGFARLLLNDHDKVHPDTERYARNIIQATGQVNGVICNMLSYTHEPGSQPSLQDLSVLARDAIMLVEPWSRDLRVPISYPPVHSNVKCVVDPVQIKQMATNLLSNALEACRGRSGAEIQVLVEPRGQEVALEVKDTGCGIPAQDISRVFEPFFSLKQDGIGLGLAMCQRVVDAHQGRHSLHSEEDCGTSVTIYFPREQTHHD